MNAADVAALAAMLEGTGIAELSLTEAGETIRLRRGGSPLSPAVGPLAEGSAPLDRPPSPHPSPASGRGGQAAAEGVAARCPGVFLTRHPLRDEELAVPGPVAAGDVVALLRVGPLFVPVIAPRAGVLSGPDVAAGSLVGYGTTLFRLQPED